MLWYIYIYIFYSNKFVTTEPYCFTSQGSEDLLEEIMEDNWFKQAVIAYKNIYNILESK